MSYAVSDFWKAFGDARFTRSDLWRTFGQQAFPGFPTPEWLEHVGVGRVQWIEAAPGKRGGEGYKLTAKAVASMRAKDAKEHAKTDRINVLMASLRPAVGELRCSNGKLHWTYWPSVGLPCGRRYFARSWPDTADQNTVQGQLDRLAIDIAELARQARAQRLAEIAKLDALILQTTGS